MSDFERFKRRDAELKARNAAVDRAAKAALKSRKAEAEAVATAERLRARKRQNKQAQRQREADARKAEMAEVALMLGDLPPIEPDADRVAADESALTAWLATPGREQGALRKLERDTPGTLMASWRVLLAFRVINESRAEVEGVPVDPGLGMFARLLSEATGRPWSKDQARRRLAVLRGLEAGSGPLSALGDANQF